MYLDHFYPISLLADFPEPVWMTGKLSFLCREIFRKKSLISQKKSKKNNSDTQKINFLNFF